MATLFIMTITAEWRSKQWYMFTMKYIKRSKVLTDTANCEPRKHYAKGKKPEHKKKSPVAMMVFKVICLE